MKTNMSFKSNVNIIHTTSTAKFDKDFLKKITDYHALRKLYDINGRTTNGSYLFLRSQVLVLFPNGNFQAPRAHDSYIMSKNNRLNTEYGYSDLDEKQLFPLIGELYLNYGSSIWNNSQCWWRRNSFYSEGAYDKVGHWVAAGQQRGTVEPIGGGTLFTSYVKQEIQRAKVDKNEFVSVEDTIFDELYEPDPYYYIYQKTAGIKSDELKTSSEINKEAAAYLQAYNIYNAFELVEQERVIQAPYDKNIFVDAGPGTGKTYTLIERINYLVEELEVDPSCIMVLCFTNAAVAEIKKRREEYVEAGGSRGLRNVDIRTFHSFAGWLINAANNELVDAGWQPVKMSKLSYDGFIVKATAIIRQFVDEVLGGWQHFIVDEIQDLTDVRARLVLEIVKGCLTVGCGVTVFGDSCQAIYDYKQEEVIDPLTSANFYKSLFHILYKNASFYKFGFNHRQTEHLKQLTVGLREAILSERISDMSRATDLLHQRMSIFPTKSFIEVAANGTLDFLAQNGKVCLLCRNNAQVLKLSEALRIRGISHIVNAYDRTGCYSAWIGRVFANYQLQKIRKEDFVNKYNQNNGQPFSGIDVWNTISRLLRKEDNQSLGVFEIIKAVYTSEVDDPIFHNFSDSKIIVSNIHKAKGREYNAVVVEQNFIKRLIGRSKKDIGEFKTLYVAVTRPKQNLYTSNMVSCDGVRVLNVFRTGRKRWGKYSNGTLKYLEIQGNVDIDVDSFKSLGDEIKEYIGKEVSVGDEIILRKSKASERFGYHIVHVLDECETVIGRCTSSFYEDLEGLLQTNDVFQWPSEIRNLYVSDIYSHIDKSVETQNDESLGEAVWNWVDFCGLGHLIFDVY